jgi:hypothetical protein
MHTFGGFAKYVLCPFKLLILHIDGGEGGIRTPDSLATMSDFESGAFNRALPPLRFVNTHLGALSTALLLDVRLADEFPCGAQIDRGPYSLPVKRCRMQCQRSSLPGSGSE